MTLVLFVVTMTLVAMLTGIAMGYSLDAPLLRRAKKIERELERYKALDALSGNDATGQYPEAASWNCPLCHHNKVQGTIDHCSPGRVALGCRQPPKDHHHSHMTCANCQLEYLVRIS